MSDLDSKVFVVDDDASFSRSIARWLRGHGYAVECYSSAEDFLARRSSHAQACVVADLDMPGMDGISMQEALKRSSDPLPVVFLPGPGEIRTSVRAMRNGAEDFLEKTMGTDNLLAAIKSALARDAKERADSLRQRELFARFAKLTSREKEVLAYVLCGLLNKQIGAHLDISERTVKRYRASLMPKLEVKSVVELAQITTKAGVDFEARTPSDILAQLDAYS